MKSFRAQQLILETTRRTMSTAQHSPNLVLDNINPCIKVSIYAALISMNLIFAGVGSAIGFLVYICLLSVFVFILSLENGVRCEGPSGYQGNSD